MSSATCAVLCAVFPLVLIALIAEGRNVHRKIRRKRSFERITSWGISLTFVGTLMAVIGVQVGGLEDGWAWIAWFIFSATMLDLFLFAALLIGSAELDLEDADEQTSDKPRRIDLFRDFVRGGRG